MGPHTFNFADAAERALQEGAAQRVVDITAAVRLALTMVAPSAAGSQADSAQKAPSAERALAFARRHRGAARHMAGLIGGLLR
jgi:3-deoxy-D-manno-octulosonic-acid transferase